MRRRRPYIGRDTRKKIFDLEVLKNVRTWGVIFLISAVLIGTFGYLNVHTDRSFGKVIDRLSADFYANLATELISIAITILIIDAIYRQREEAREKNDLILQMGSPDNGFALEAVRKLRARGWLNDGSLVGKYFCSANLKNADLAGAELSFSDFSGADLREARLNKAKMFETVMDKTLLSRADLREAYLVNAKLNGVQFNEADLRGANLTVAKLQGADLGSAKLVGADLSLADLTNARVEQDVLNSAKSLTRAILPDGTRYEAGPDRKIDEGPQT